MRATLLSGMIAMAGCGGIRSVSIEPKGLETPNPVEQYDCTAFEADNGQTYNCAQLDRCNETDIEYRDACCQCDPILCDADPGCSPPPATSQTAAESCMVCHNGSAYNDYAGVGISNPHPFPGADYLRCTQCHGGDPNGVGMAASHVPRPPEIGDDEGLYTNFDAYFNFLTLTGVDKYPDYTDPNYMGGNPVKALDWLQFDNPGDIRAVGDGRSCGQSGCHGGEHADWFPKGFIAGEQGFYSNTLMTVGSAPGNTQAASNPSYNYDDTAADWAFRSRTDPSWVYDPSVVGPVDALLESPEYAQMYGNPSGFYNNPLYDANTIAAQRYTANANGTYVNQVIPGSQLEQVVIESVTFQCGDCHAGDKGQNNRYADFRSSGCTVCHMNYSFDGRSRSTDPNVRKDEPLNPDAIATPERPHVETHQIRNVAKILPNGAFIRGVSDNACVGCHQGSNRTVLQYWGIRLDQNQDVVNGFQYPANPVTFSTTQFDTRLFDPAVANTTFNGRNFNQYLLEEDYDGDQRDDTPPDVHYEAGLGCIDCHGSRDVHNGTDGDPNNGKIWSKMGQTVGIECVDCHGTVDETALTTTCEDYLGVQQECGVDRFGNALRNTYKDANGDMWLVSRLDGLKHFIPQLYDVVVDTNRVNPLNQQLIYDPISSYAMGRADGNPTNGIGPEQTNPGLYTNGFSHMDNLSCDSCHAAWENNCIGCHLQLQYNANPNAYFYSNTTGERIVVQVTNADFTYIQPNWYFLEVNAKGQIGAGWAGMKPFYRYVDLNGNQAAGITFTDRHGLGDNPNYNGSGAFPAMSHNRIAPHSIRGKQTAQYEGSKNCVACHLNTDQINNEGAAYQQYFTDIETRNYAGVNFPLLQTEIGLNTNNALNSPYYVHMVAGLGTGLMLADNVGCPVNPLDNNANRQFCPNGAPANNFDLNNVAFDWDKVVEGPGTPGIAGTTNASLTQPLLETAMIEGDGTANRGAPEQGLSGPLAAQLLQKLADPNAGLVLDSYIDANAQPQGGAAAFVAP